MGASTKPLAGTAGGGDDTANITRQRRRGPRIGAARRRGDDFLAGGAATRPDRRRAGQRPASRSAAATRSSAGRTPTALDNPDDRQRRPSTSRSDDVANDGLGGRRDRQRPRRHRGAQPRRRATTSWSDRPARTTIRGGGGNDKIDGARRLRLRRRRRRQRHDHGARRARRAGRLRQGGRHARSLDDVDASLDCETISVSDQVRPDVDADGARKPGDCDDNNPAIRPGATEVARERRRRGLRRRRRGQVLDRDGDGVPRPQDCDDTRTRRAARRARRSSATRSTRTATAAPEPFPTLARHAERSGRSPSPRTRRSTGCGSSRVRRGQRVRLTCKGGGCPFEPPHDPKVRKRGRLDLAPAAARRRATARRRDS